LPPKLQIACWMRWLTWTNLCQATRYLALVTRFRPQHELGGPGADKDWVVAALLHDIGDIYAPYNHDEYAAAIIRPFVREQCSCVVEKHGDFQLLYYGQHVGANPDKRDAYRGNRYFEDCAEFCEKWDQPSSDPDYPTEQLSFFAPLVKEVFARKAYDPAAIRKGERVPLVQPLA
jgi:predicted HD phosphohydrolase